MKLKLREQPRPSASGGPVAEAVVHALPRAKAFRKVPPRMPVFARYSTASISKRSPSLDFVPDRRLAHKDGTKHVHGRTEQGA